MMTPAAPDSLDDLIARIEELSAANARGQRLMQRLLNNVGSIGECGWCKAKIVWIAHKSGKGAPYDPDGEIHFATCPNYPKKGDPRRG